MRARAFISLVSLLVLLSSACASTTGGDETKSAVPRRVVAFSPATGAAVLEPFGGRLYGAIASARDGNVAVSPYSVVMALMMVRAGAAGATRAQLTTALELDGVEDADAILNAIDAELARRAGTFRRPDGSNSEVKVATANAVWAQRGYPIETAFLDRLARDYGAGLRTVNYKTDAEGSRQAINRWVSERTNKKIPELIPKGVLDALTRLVLTNAVYVKAAWQEPFETKATAAAPFERLDGRTTTVDFMNQTTEYGYVRGEAWQAARLPLAGGQLTFDIVLPDKGRFEEVERAVANGALTLEGIESRPVALALPRFRLRSSTNLVDALRSLGITDLFDSKADLSAITTAEQLFVSDVLHEAYVAVDEAGVEAAAATAVVIKATAAPVQPVVMRVDRPFLFVLRDLPTGTPMFIGRLVDPS